MDKSGKEDANARGAVALVACLRCSMILPLDLELLFDFETSSTTEEDTYHTQLEMDDIT